MYNQPLYNQPPAKPSAPWLTLFAVDIALSVVTFVVFGVLGGLFMLLALNGFNEKEGGAILTGYAVVVLVGNASVAALVNWMIVRIRQAVGAWPILVPAIATTAVMAMVGPPLAYFFIRYGFSR